MLGGRASPLAALRPRAAGIPTVGLPAVAGPAEVEHRLAPRPAAAQRSPHHGSGHRPGTPRRLRGVRRRRGVLWETGRTVGEDGGASPGGRRSRARGSRRRRDRTHAAAKAGAVPGRRGQRPRDAGPADVEPMSILTPKYRYGDDSEGREDAIAMTLGSSSYRRVFETTGSDASSARSVPRFGRPNTSDSPSSNTVRARARRHSRLAARNRTTCQTVQEVREHPESEPPKTLGRQA